MLIAIIFFSLLSIRRYYVAMLEADGFSRLSPGFCLYAFIIVISLLLLTHITLIRC